MNYHINQLNDLKNNELYIQLQIMTKRAERAEKAVLELIEELNKMKSLKNDIDKLRKNIEKIKMGS